MPDILDFVKKLIFGDGERIGLDAMIGRIGQVTEKIDNNQARGRVKVGDEEWKARSTDNSIFEIGEIVVVKRILELTLHVSRK